MKKYKKINRTQIICYPNLLAAMVATALLIALGACKEIFEENIEDENVILIAPADGVTISQNAVSFWWEEVYKATYYNLQIVSPGFDSADMLIVDTNLTTNQFQYELFAGDFQWRVSAYNSAYATNYTVNSLHITETDSLSGKLVILKTPANNLITNQTDLSFAWYNLSGADGYRFEVDISGTVIYSVNLDTSTISFPYYGSGTTEIYPAFDEGEYVWRVVAYNDGSQSAEVVRMFMVDTTAPLVSVPSTPLNGAVFTDSLVTISWNRNNDLGSAIQDSLIIYSDSLYNNLVLNTLTSDTVYQFIAPVKGTYFWYLLSVDKAGNSSYFYSSMRKFKYE